MKRLTALVATVLVGLAFLSVPLLRAGGAVGDPPLPYTPYSGFAASLTRAPYVTDLTQTSAYINWATSVDAPGSVAVVPASNGACPSSIPWSSTAIGVTTSLPGPVNATSPSGTMTGWEFTVTGNLGTTNEYQSSVPVKGLSPATQYCYTVFSTDNANAVDLLPAAHDVQTFTTLNPVSTTSSQPVSFDVVDDTGENYAYTSATTATDKTFPGGVNPDEASLYQQIGQSGADFLLSVGDIAYSGATQSTFGDLEQTGTQPEVSNFFGPSYYPLAGGIPTFAGSGDHGQNVNPLKVFPTPNTATTSGGVYAFDSYPGTVDGIAGTAPDDWYAFSTGDVRIYVIDGAWADGVSGRLGTTTGSLCGSASASETLSCQAYQADADEHWQTTSPEYKWLKADLAAYPGGVKMAVFHFPLRSVNASQPSDPYVDNSSSNPNASTSLEKLLSSNGVRIAFNGHAHTYQRIVPNNYAQNGQLVNYVTGGGGGVLEPVAGGSCTTMTGTASVYALGWSPTTNVGSACGPGVPKPTSAADVYNFLKVTVSGDTVTVDPTNAAGKGFDPMTYTYPTTTQPSTPGNVTATLTTSQSTALVNWSPSTEVGGSITSYQIARNGTTIATLPPTATSFTDTTLVPGTTYVYRVTAIGSVGPPSWPGTSNVLTTTAASSTGTVAPSGPNTPQTSCVRHLASGSVVGAASLDSGLGYYEVDGKGDVANFGAAVCYGALSGLHLNKPIVGMATDTATGGYWLVASDGGVFAFNAPFYGSTGALHLNKPIVGMAYDPVTGGYWLVASDGGIFSGHAPFHGSTGAIRLNKPIVGMAVDQATGGYWLVASDGGVFSFDAPFHGSTGDIQLNAPVVGIIASKGGKGYRLVAADGGVFVGHAPFWGSAGNLPLVKPVIGGMNDDANDGYWLVASDGGVFSYHAPFFGSAA